MIRKGVRNMRTKKLGLNDIEELNYLAEEVLVRLRYEFYQYDDEGNDLYLLIGDETNKTQMREKRLKAMETWEKEKVHNNHPLEFRDNTELQKITFSEAMELSYDVIKEKYLKDFLPKMRGIMRKDTMCIGFAAGDEISDEYLDNLLAHRYQENLKLWTMQWGMDNSFYFLLYGNTEFHDDDEYIGIYGSSAALLQGYREALKNYKDDLPGGKHEMRHEGSSLPPDQLIIYEYTKHDGKMSFVMTTPGEMIAMIQKHIYTNQYRG